MVIIGGGVIGVEMASIYARIGVEVTIIEYADSLIPTMDKELGKELKKIFSKQNIKILLSHKVQSAKNNGKNATVTFLDTANATQEITADYCLVAVGRKPYTENLGLDKIGLKLDDYGRIEVNDKLETNIPGVYAIGDVIKGAMLAHKAEEEGVFAAEILAGQKPHVNYLLIPGVIYTWPEVASVGFTEDQLIQQDRKYNVGSFPFRASGRARASMDLDGFVKVLADKTSDEILGVHIIGPRAADMIAEGVLAMEFRASAEDIARISHAHPTYSEAFKEACLDASGNRALHL